MSQRGCRVGRSGRERPGGRESGRCRSGPRPTGTARPDATRPHVSTYADPIAALAIAAGASCYHDPCDSLTPVADGGNAALYAQLEADYDLYGGLNTFALDTNADAIATAVLTFAFDTSAVNDEPRAPGKSHGAGRSADAHGHAAA